MKQTDYDSIYKALNLSLLKNYAEHWGKKFSCIKRIALYLVAPDNYSTDLQYVLAANVPTNPGANSDESNYHAWADGINVRADELSKVYKGEPPPNHNFQWQWLNLEVDGNIAEYHNFDGSDFVLPGTEYVLYEKDMKTQVAQSSEVFLKENGADEKIKPEIIRPQLEKTVNYIKTIDCSKLTNDEIIQLLEKKKIRFDYERLPKIQIQELINWLRGQNISNRVIALILQWPKIKSGDVKLNSVIRSMQRKFPNI
jgi:hypothetical protein